MALSLTVLGSAGSHCGPGRVCSGYLVDDGTTRVLVDAGNGSTANLLRHVAWPDVDAVVVSHGHADHCVDLVGAYHWHHLAPGGAHRLPMHAPEGVVETVLGAMGRTDRTAFDDVFTPNVVTGGDAIEIGSLRVEFFDSVHLVPTVSMRITDGRRTLTYSGDSAGGPHLVTAARDADLFLCEATWQGDAEQYPDGIHLTAADAGRLATEAGVDHLVLTHVAGGLDVERSRQEASATFAGRVSMADDNERYTA